MSYLQEIVGDIFTGAPCIVWQ